MKKCSKCNQIKENVFFNKDKRKKDGLSPWCKSCKSQHSKRPDQKARYQKNNRDRRTKMRNYMLSHLSKSVCAKCGESDIRVLEYNHIRGKKSKGISCIINDSNSIEELQREMDKCEVICANCHRKYTYAQSNSARHIIWMAQQKGEKVNL